ncbi:MAG TPA: methionine adenosyltransferase [Alphaproteobacteria bacterium]|nr:methionine adenosyltransferase [Alphaproteobacteria bacterium]
MMRKNYLFTSESVSEGHPDKVCDSISDTLLDLFLTHDPQARSAVETMATTDRVIICGEARLPETVDKRMMEDAIRKCIKDIGYEQKGFDWQTVEIQNYLHKQSSDIARGVDEAENKEEGAGDQGIIFGYATNELANTEYSPATLYLSHGILKELARLRHSGEIKWLRPDAKSQVTLNYENGIPVGVDSIVVSTQHTEDVSYEEIRETVRSVIYKLLPDGWTVDDKKFYVNPTGRFVTGGPDGDTGLTGRKIIVDSYGGAVAHGGGAFSGKDPTKVDRSAAYATRYLAKNIVAAGLAEKAMIQVAYAIGVAKPLAVYLETYGTCKVDEEKLEKLLPEVMDLSPRGIRTHLKLNRPIYLPTSRYGHFGRTPGVEGAFPWEKTDLADILRREF